MIRRTIFEWGKLEYGPDPLDLKTIPMELADRIAAVAAISPLAGTGILEQGRKSLRARNIVGVIAAEGCQLEILPKIDSPSNEENDDATIRRRLVQMLAVALNIKIDVGAITELDCQRETLLELLIKLFAEKLADAVRQGMPRRYMDIEDDLPALRGSLDVTRQFTRHVVNPTKLSCRFDELSTNIALNQIMKAVVLRLSKLARSYSSQKRLQELVFTYAEVTLVSAKELRWDQVSLDRTNRKWAELLSLARFLLSEQFQTSTRGTTQGFSLLFDMNVLFEEYVARMLKKALAGSPYQVVLQGGRRYCLSDRETGRTLFQTKPDILIRDGNRIAHIIDTKWKRMSSRLDDPKQGVGQADVYQMMAYGQLYEPQSLTLLYPHHQGLSQAEGVQTCFRIAAGNQILNIASIDISNEKQISHRLRHLLNEMLLFQQDSESECPVF